jgi:hypothetical protein
LVQYIITLPGGKFNLALVSAASYWQVVKTIPDLTGEKPG